LAGSSNTANGLQTSVASATAGLNITLDPNKTGILAAGG
jgi:hypothetical protein